MTALLFYSILKFTAALALWILMVWLMHNLRNWRG